MSAIPGIKGGETVKTLLEAMSRQLGPAKHVRVGFLEGSTCGKHNDAHAPSVAFWNEYGTVSHPKAGGEALLAPGNTHIPPRPFFSTMIARKGPTWGKLCMAMLKQAKYNQTLALHGVGLKIAEQLQESIENWTSPRNADSTIASKGFDKPLEESKNMKRAVSFEVTE